jgi:hypothetical protein
MAGKPRVHIRMDGEKPLTAPVELPASTPVVSVAEPVNPEPVVATEIKTESAEPISVKDTMSLRPDVKSDPAETSPTS